MTRAPIAAANMSELMTMPSCRRDEPEFLGHRALSAVGHARVVAEQQAAEAGHDRDEAEPLAVGAVGQRWQLGFGRRGCMCSHASHARTPWYWYFAVCCR